jgi:hypothetical protein
MSDDVTIGRWSESPYTSYDKRHITIDHRVRIIDYGGGMVDVVHERRQNDGDRGEWEQVAYAEVREHGMTHRKVRDGVMSE